MGVLLLLSAQVLPAYSQAQTTVTGYYAAPELKAIPGLVYSPPPEVPTQPTIQGIPGALSPGNITSPNPGESRAWPQGASIDRVVKIRDLDPKVNPQFAGFTKNTLRSFNRNIGTDIGGVPLKDVQLVNGLNLEQVKQVYNNGDIKIKNSLPIVQALLGVVFDPASARKQLQQNAISTGKKALINRLNKEKALKDIPFEQLLEGDWRGTITEGEQILLREIGDQVPDYVRRLPVGSVTISVLEGDFSKAQEQAKGYAVNEIFELTLDEALEKFPELQKIPVGSIASIANQPLDQSLPQIADLAIENIPGAKDKLLSAVPGLGESAVGEVVTDIIGSLIAGTLFAKFDILHGGHDGPEEFLGRPMSGGFPDNKFKRIPGIKSTQSKTKDPKRGFPRWEMRPAVVGGLIGDKPILGMEWMDRLQRVPGCNGVMCIFGKWQPAGIKPAKALPVQFSIGDSKEDPEGLSSSRIWVDFQICISVLFEKHCTGHIISYKTPWVVKNGSLFPVVAGNRFQDLFPGVDPGNQTVDFCKAPPFLLASNTGSGQATTAGNSPPSGEAEAFAQFKKASDDIGIAIDRDADGTLLIDPTNELATIAWVKQEAKTYGLEVIEKNGSITFGYTGNAQASQANSPTFTNTGFTTAKPGETLAPTLSGIPGQPNATSSATSPSPANKSQPAKIIGKSAWGSERDVYNLMLTSLLESDGLKNQVDVSVAIMNRVASANHPGTITDVVFEKRQYQPNFGTNPVSSKEEVISRIAKKHGGIHEAVVAYDRLEKALNDPAQIAESQDFLKGATDFRGQSLLHNKRPGDPYRGDIGANWYLQESQDPRLAAAVLGTLGVESTGVDYSAIRASASQSAYCDPSSPGSPGSANIDNSNFTQGSGVASGRLADPLGQHDYKLTSDYGWRNNPKTGERQFHKGIDLAHWEGTPFGAADGGTVVMSEWVKGYGNYILIDHGNGLASWYGHNKVNYVKVGDTVDPGQPIGEVGNTGRSTGPHIDFGVIEGFEKGNKNSGSHVNPRKHVNLPALGGFNQP